MQQHKKLQVFIRCLEPDTCFRVCPRQVLLLRKNPEGLSLGWGTRELTGGRQQECSRQLFACKKNTTGLECLYVQVCGPHGGMGEPQGLSN